MQNIRSIKLDEGSKEELLPGFEAEFPYIATCAELDKYLEPIVPWHWHRTVELFYMESGCLEYTTPNRNWIFPAGSGGFVNSNVLHTSQLRSSGESNIQLLHLFDPSLLSGESGSRMESKYILPLTTSPSVEIIPLYLEDPVHTQILADMRQAFELSPQDWGYEFALRNPLSQIWLKLFDLARPAVEQEHYSKNADDKIKALMVYVHEHYRESISVAQLAKAAHISNRVCFRLFQENLYITPVEYMRSYRLQKACEMLTKTAAPLPKLLMTADLVPAAVLEKHSGSGSDAFPPNIEKNGTIVIVLGMSNIAFPLIIPYTSRKEFL